MHILYTYTYACTVYSVFVCEGVCIYFKFVYDF